MKLAFVNYTEFKYTVETPLREPLGGSESALCYLTQALARNGHEVTLFCDGVDKEKKINDIIHIPRKDVNKKSLKNLDALIIQNTPWVDPEWKKMLSPKTKLIFWSQHAANQPAVELLKNKEVVDMYDMFVLISIWQVEDYVANFPIPRNKIALIRNAIAPAFEKMFDNSRSILQEKTNPPILCYTSTPFRGLDILLSIFPDIQKEIPDVTLKIYGGMETYQDKSGGFDKLYKVAKGMKNVEVVGAMGQKQLAEELKKVTALTYPNNFAETGCTSVLEAMAAGLLVVTSDFGALSETSMGFAQTVSVNQNLTDYKNKFIELLKSGLNHPEKEEIIRRQVDFVNNTSTWSLRAREWENWIDDLVKKKPWSIDTNNSNL